MKFSQVLLRRLKETWSAGFKSELFRVCQAGCKIVGLWRFAGRGAQKRLHAHLWSCTNRRKKKTMRTMKQAGRMKWRPSQMALLPKNSSLNEVGLCRWYGDRIELVWRSAGIAGRLCFLFSTQKSCAQPCCKEYCSFSVVVV